MIAPSIADLPRATTIDTCGYPRGLERTAEHVAYAADKCGQLLDASGVVVAALDRTKTYATAVGFSVNGKQLAVGYQDGHVEIRDAASGAITTSFDGHRDPISALAFHGSGSLLASGSSDGTIMVWDLAR